MFRGSDRAGQLGLASKTKGYYLQIPGWLLVMGTIMIDQIKRVMIDHDLIEGTL